MFSHDYDFYCTDDSFDYGQGIHHELGYHGITVNFDDHDNVISWKGYGHFEPEVEKIKTKKELSDYINMHLADIEEVKEPFRTLTREEVIKELMEFLDI